MAARLLFVGDIHLGRRPGRWSSALQASTGIDVSELSAEAAWRQTVTLALESRVDAMVLAGDVVDHVENRFEAGEQLRRGIERLRAAGIRVLAVAGNHDVEALPRVADRLGPLELLGRGGRWRSERIEGRDGTAVDLWGWSFPSERFESSPLGGESPTPREAVASLGVLHCDLDASASRYAPVSRQELEAVPLDAWLLGHIHKPDRLEGDRPIGYLGSLAGLDAGEPGPHGPWIVEVNGPGRVRAIHRPLSPMRWERVDLQLNTLTATDERDVEDELFVHLEAALRAVHARLGAEAPARAPRAVGCRVHVSGRGRHRGIVHRLLHEEERWPVCELDGTHYFVEKVLEQSAPDLDLADLARGADPPALLAQRLLELERGGERARALRARVAALLESELSRRRPLRSLEESELDADAVDAVIGRVGARLLDSLLAQRRAEAPDAGSPT